MINSKKSHPHKKENKKNEEDVTCYNCGKSGHYRKIYMSLNKHNKKKDIDAYKTNGKCAKGRRSSISWEEEEENSSSSSISISYDECVSLCLMVP